MDSKFSSVYFLLFHLVDGCTRDGHFSFNVIEKASSAPDVDKSIDSARDEFLDTCRYILIQKKKTETQQKKLRRYVFGIHAVRGNVTKPGSAKGKPQFATKPGSTKGKGPSSPLAWVNKRQGLRFATVYSVSIYLSYGIFVEMSLKASRGLLK